MTWPSDTNPPELRVHEDVSIHAVTPENRSPPRRYLGEVKRTSVKEESEGPTPPCTVREFQVFPDFAKEVPKRQLDGVK